MNWIMRRSRAVTVAAGLAVAVAMGAAGLEAAGQQQPADPAEPRQMLRGGMWMGAGPLGDLALGLRRLELTDHQREQIREILQRRQPEMREIARRTMEARQAVDDAVTDDFVDEALIRERSAALATVQADAAVLRAHVRADVWQVLTPEQQQQARELRERVQQRFERGANRLWRLPR